MTEATEYWQVRWVRSTHFGTRFQQRTENFSSIEEAREHKAKVVGQDDSAEIFHVIETQVE